MEEGERIPFKRAPLSQEERQQLAKQYLIALHQRSPTAADYAAGASYYGPSEADQREHERAINAALAGLTEEDTKLFFEALGQFGFPILLRPELNGVVEGWRLTILDPEVSQQDRASAESHLTKMNTVLWAKGSGRTREVTADVAQRISAIYAEEYARCRAVRKLGKGSWNTPQERHRQIGKRLNISPHEASSLEAEGLHLTPSAWAREQTAKRTGYSEEIVRLTLRSRRSLTS